MKAVILAAGQCSRARSLTLSPKCLLSWGDQSILGNQLSGLSAAGVSEFAIVVGYKGREIVQYVHDHFPELLHRITYVDNPAFRETNNIYSLYLAEPWISGQKFICLNADILCDPCIFTPAVETNAAISMVIDPEFREETMKVIIQNDRIVTMRKGIPREVASGTYLGITTFSASVCQDLFGEIRTLLAENREREFFNVAVQRLADRGVPISYTKTNGLPWAEIDDPTDWQFALEQVIPKLTAWEEAALAPCYSEGPLEPVERLRS